MSRKNIDLTKAGRINRAKLSRAIGIIKRMAHNPNDKALIAEVTSFLEDNELSTKPEKRATIPVKESIVCAAVKCCLAKDDFEGSVIVKGLNYTTIWEDGLLDYISKEDVCNVFVMGFMTSTGRFVDPKQALIISGRGREMRFQERDYLLPEDLY